jgi:hypothetical protein
MMWKLSIILVSCLLLSSCLAAAAVGVAGKVVGSTVDVAGDVVGAAIPDGDDDDKDKDDD